MGTTADKLQYLIDAKSAISAAIEAKGGTVPTELSGYAQAILNIPSGGGGDIEKFQSLVNRSITSVSSSDLGNITSIGGGAFYNCSGLTSVIIGNGVKSIGERAFYQCSSLTSITIPDSVTSIGIYAFYKSSLTSITIPNSVKSIGNDAFYGCGGLTSITIPDSVTSIEKNTFYGCGGLTSITIPDSVTSIGPSAFSYCISLTSITIPDSVTSIGAGAFQTSKNLATIDFGTTRTTIPTLVNKYAFGSIKSNYQILVPSALLTDWKAANVWNDSTIVNHIVAHP